MMFNRFIAALARKLGLCRRNTTNGCFCIGVALIFGGALPTVAHADNTVVLKSGDRLSGTIVEQTSTTLVLQHPVLGRIEIPTEHVAELINTSATEQADAAGQDVAQEPLARPQEDSGGASADADTPAPPEPEKSEWTSHFLLGVSAKYGITDEQDVNIGVTSVRETPRLKTRLDAAYDFGLSKGDRTDNNFTAGVQHDWLVPDSRWFYFVQGRFDYDEFDSWEERLSAHGGIGRFLVVKDDFNLAARLGIGGVKEWGSVDEDLRPEGMLGGEFTWTVSDRQSIEARAGWHPWLDDLVEFRTRSELRWRYRFHDESNMSLSAGLRHEYESTTDPGIDHNDLRIIVGVDFEF